MGPEAFPKARHEDFYAGHSWASGIFFMGQGKAQESSSEAANAYYGAYLLATSLGDVALADWCTCFPCFGFLLCCEPSRTDECIEIFTRTGLAAAKVGSINDSGSIEILSDGERREVLNLREETVTGLIRTPSDTAAIPVKNV